MGGRGASGGVNNRETGERLEPGETAYVRMPPTPFNKEGQIVVTKTENDVYLYKVRFDKTDRKVDTSSEEYHQALREFNIHASFNADGSVTVTRGGLFDRKRKFGTIDAFQKEANRRLDGIIKTNQWELQSLKKGHITQMAAENLKYALRNETPSNAIKEFNKSLQEGMHSHRTRAEAAENMKAKLDSVTADAKKKVKKR